MGGEHRVWYGSAMYLVDAFNVLHALPKAEPRLAGLTLDGLASLIGVVGRFRGEGVVLVCDGTAGGRGWRTGEQVAPGVVVHLAGPGRDADSVIEERLVEWERLSRTERCTVVSNDRRVVAAAVGVAGGRAGAMSSDEFLRTFASEVDKLNRGAGERAGGRTDLGARERLDSDAAAYWLREFGLWPQPPKREEWGGEIDPDDLDMGKWLGEPEDRNGK